MTARAPRHFRHLTFTDRLRIEAMCKAKYRPAEIAKTLRVDRSTIYRELKRGRYTHLNGDYTTEERYSPDIAHEKYRINLQAKGADLKIGRDHKLAEYIEQKILREHYSPEAVLGEIRVKALPFQTTICKATLYSYIDKGIFLHLTNKDLPYKPHRRRKQRNIRPAHPPRGESISNRPPEVDSCGSFGHWEMDCVIGKQGTKSVLLVLTERLTRREHMIRMPDKSAASVVRALDRLERRYGTMFAKVFQTITVDNGPEFSDCKKLERSVLHAGKRTKLYYCHPYSSFERGTNENLNKMIRRRVPKGTNIARIKAGDIQRTEDWINNYPRRIFGYETAQMVFDRELSKLAAASQ